ncbi:MAG TPA: carboxypeptidase regulatory-like domain-containing protein [Bryobacteraceae bacterium]|nr:carboxypeptidase regulatory-like domain-containing protein [Bryobacteraceae bacterium]
MPRFAVAIAAMLATAAFAQSDRGRISGRVFDPSGAVVPRAAIVVENPGKDLKRESVTDIDGTYLVDGLLSATYKITVSASGFAVSVISDVPLAVGQERVIDVHLQPASVKESVTVASGALAAIDTSSASIGAVVSSREVTDLPINGRMVSQLYLLIPGATASGAGTFDDVRFAGRSNEQNTIRYDGIQAGTIIDANPADLNGASTSQYRLSMSMENIQEFRVEASTYSAEYGRGTGGQVEIITKSGSNALHGDMFEFLRNSFFDARNDFDHGAVQAPLRLNQFGGAVGGPIIKDRLFFFASQENLLQRVYVPFLQDTLSAYARAQAVPAIQPLLAAYPLGNAGSTSSPYFDLVSVTLPSYVNEYFGNVRFDYRVNDKNSLYLRYSRDQGYSSSPTDASGSGSVTTQVAQNGIADLTTVIRPNIVNDFKFGVNPYKSRLITEGANVPGLNISNLTFSIGGAAQSGATGIITPTGAGSTPLEHAQPYTNYELSYIDNLSWTHGAHSFKMGVEANSRVLYCDQIGGAVYTFTNIQNFLADQPSQIQMGGTLSAANPFWPGVTGPRKGLQYFAGGYFQDEWKITPRFTMNIGLRYDYFSPLTEANNHTLTVNTVTGALNTSGYAGYTTSKLNFGPHLAFSWSPEAAHDKTVFRVGAGYYYGPGQEEDQIQPILNGTPGETLTTGVAYPMNINQILANFDPNSPNAQFQPRVYAVGYNLPEKVLSYSASVQQTLPDSSIVTLAYVGSQGRNEFQRTIANLITGVATDPATGNAIITRQFGNQYAELDVKTSFGRSHYDSLQLSWNRRLVHGLTATAQYSWSHNIGTSQGSNEATTSENNYNFSSERGDNSTDIRQYLNAAALYQLPFGAGHRYNFGSNKLLNSMFGDWQVGENLLLHAGLPVNVLIQRNNVLYYDPQNGSYYTSPVLVGGVPITQSVINIPGGGQSRGTQRPNLIPGVDPYLNTGSGFMLNPAAFSIPAPGSYGDLGRDALRGPGFAQLDLTMSKNFRFGERARMELRGDFYNLPNHPNWANPIATMSGGIPSGPTASGVQPGQAMTRAAAGSSFGLINSTVGKYINDGTSRQIQLALRLVF